MSNEELLMGFKLGLSVLLLGAVDLKEGVLIAILNQLKLNGHRCCAHTERSTWGFSRFPFKNQFLAIKPFPSSSTPNYPSGDCSDFQGVSLPS